jgi:chaperone modulatory protein CbpM
MNTLTLTEVCRRVSLPEHAVIEIVEVGIVRPVAGTPVAGTPVAGTPAAGAPAAGSARAWRFDDQTLVVLSRAARLHEDLDLDWHGVALALDLLEELDTLRRENEQLRQRLSRFLD